MKQLNKYKALSFDVYGTLIDWEYGIELALKPLTDRIGPFSQGLSEAFHEIERNYVLDHPGEHYIDAMKACYIQLAVKKLKNYDLKVIEKEGQVFASSVSQWPPHKDTIEAMTILKKHYKLIALSNVDWALFNGTLKGPLREVVFDATYIAEDIGSYKPELKNFDYLKEHIKEDFGIESEDILHVAYSVHCDIDPATKIGLDNLWIARYDGKLEGASHSDFDNVKKGSDESDKLYFNSLKELGDAVTTSFSNI